MAHHQAPKCKAKLQICNEKNSNSKLNAYLLNEVYILALAHRLNRTTQSRQTLDGHYIDNDSDQVVGFQSSSPCLSSIFHRRHRQTKMNKQKKGISMY